jgi:hypothetical protein
VKTQYINFTTKSNSLIEMDIRDVNELMTSSKQAKLLGLTINSTLTGETHVENVINKLCTACYMIRNRRPFVSINTLKIIYYSYFHSLMTYSLIFRVIRHILTWF